jgi:putative inorganic carbon (hco3(-)) transporter
MGFLHPQSYPLTRIQERKQSDVLHLTLSQITLYLTYGSLVSILFSIAISQILLGLSLLCLAISRKKLRFPAVSLALAFFFLQTVASLMLSGHAGAGLPQIRKFFVFTVLLVACNTLNTAPKVRRLVIAWTVVASFSALAGVVQFLARRSAAIAQQDTSYVFYLDGRITGFMSHWMTFGGEEMIVALMLAAYLLFAPHPRKKWLLAACVPLLIGAIVLSLSRSIFLLGLPAGLLYLLWQRKRITVVAVLLIGACFIPHLLRDRFVSAFEPHGDFDSNSRHAVMRQVGWQMVKAHPWFGVGPEQVGAQFQQYIPASASRPLPKGWYGHLHNIYFQYAAERGIPALLFLLWFIGKALLDFRQGLAVRTGNNASTFVLQGAIAVILAVLAEGMFEHNLGDSEVLTLFLTVIGCGYAALHADLAQRFLPLLHRDHR